MELTLSDMDNFTLAELDNYTLKELDNMSYDELVDAVYAKCQIADNKCNKNIVLSDDQIGVITGIVNTYAKELKRDSLLKTITVGVAINAIWDFLKYLTATTADYLPEIVEELKQVYTLLDQLIQQIPQ